MYTVCTQYVLSTGWCQRHSQTATSQWRSSPATLSTSEYKLCVYLLGVAQCCDCCVGTYYAIVPYHLVVLSSCIYWYISPCNAAHDPEDFWHFDLVLGTTRCTALIAMQIWMYRVPNWNVEILRIVSCIARWYVPVCTAIEQYKVVWYCSIVLTDTE
jgi:hypothetical protein